uniref:Small ribosomal subunit protein bS18c n=1 Tax=Oedogonium capilliforme TaxID=2831087 RepID=A0A8E5I503_9CHLO|nr:ribosomal protein S18 [Oedogonium capilliforme]
MKIIKINISLTDKFISNDLDSYNCTYNWNLNQSKKSKGIQQGRRHYRNRLQEKRQQNFQAYLMQRRIRSGFETPKLDKKRAIPIIAPKSIFILLKPKNKIIYDRKFIDYKNRSLLQEYISFDGKILPKRKTGVTTKQQRFLTKAIKTARILGLLPFVKKEKGFFR